MNQANDVYERPANPPRRGWYPVDGQRRTVDYWDGRSWELDWRRAAWFGRRPRDTWGIAALWTLSPVFFSYLIEVLTYPLWGSYFGPFDLVGFDVVVWTCLVLGVVSFGFAVTGLTVNYLVWAPQSWIAALLSLAVTGLSLFTLFLMPFVSNLSI